MSIRLAELVTTTPPKIVSMTMTSRCNLRCVMCDHAVRNVKKEDFDPLLIDQIGDFIGKADIVDLTGLGEPTLSSLFWKILDRFPAVEAKSDKDFPLMFNTNAVALKGESIDLIMSSRVGRIRVSIDSPDEKTFEDIRGTPLQNVVANAKRLVEARNGTGRVRPVVGIEMTVMRRNIDQMQDMIDLTRNVGADFVEFWSINEIAAESARTWLVERPGVRFCYQDELLSNYDPEKLSNAVKAASEYAEEQCIGALFAIPGNRSCTTQYPRSAEYYTNIQWRKDSIRCILPWNELRATYGGDLFVCCWGPRPLGNLKTTTMAETWNGSVIREMRRDLIAGVVPASCKGAACQALANHNAEARKRMEVASF
jgi:MoaA/NifB/PqqE/SkfB family radical SAM enzyme